MLDGAMRFSPYRQPAPPQRVTEATYSSWVVVPLAIAVAGAVGWLAVLTHALSAALC